MRAGFAHVPLHGGKAPAWLFDRMVLLAREVLAHIVAEYGSAEPLRRLSDPFWFQAFGCVLGFDWHSSGVTTTVCGAVKEGIRGRERDYGFFAGRWEASELIHGQAASVRDPARFAFAHGGRDGHPFPVDRAMYDRTVDALRSALERGKIDRSEKVRALKRLAGLTTLV